MNNSLLLRILLIQNKVSANNLFLTLSENRQMMKQKSLKNRNQSQRLTLQGFSFSQKQIFQYSRKQNSKYNIVCEVIYQLPSLKNNMNQQEFGANFQKILTLQSKYFELHSLMKHQFILKSYQIKIQTDGIKLIQQQFQSTLNQVERQKLSYTKKLQIVNCIAKSISYLSEHGICHRGINLDSICICQESEYEIVAKLNNLRSAFILDKQNLKQYQDINLNTALIHRYSAPEVKNNQAPNIKSDIWSLGAVFYEILFDGLDHIKLWNNRTQLFFPEGTPTWLCSVLCGMLAIDPQQRYSIGHVVSILKSAIICAETTQKCFHDIKTMNSKKQNLENLSKRKKNSEISSK